MLLADNGQFTDAHLADPRGKNAGARPERNRRMIPHGDSLYAPGNHRTSAYRVESGALCHYVVWPDGSHDVIEFAFPGDIVGLGSLTEHVSTAQAIVDTSVVLLEGEELEKALAADAALASRMSAATDREFEYLRRRALQPGLRPIRNRLAAYLIAAAGHACRSGDTHVVAGSDGAAGLAAMLDVTAADIEATLTTLQAESLIGVRDGAIVIADFAGLEAVADA